MSGLKLTDDVELIEALREANGHTGTLITCGAPCVPRLLALASAGAAAEGLIDLAAERDQLIADVQALQRKNSNQASMIDSLRCDCCDELDQVENILDEAGRESIPAAKHVAALVAEMRRLHQALETIAQWDCLNPPATHLLGDLAWLKGHVETALKGDSDD